MDVSVYSPFRGELIWSFYYHLHTPATVLPRLPIYRPRIPRHVRYFIFLSSTYLHEIGVSFHHTADAVRKALLATTVLFQTDPSELTSSTVVDALDGDWRLRRVKWNDIDGIPITKLAVTHGLCKSRCQSFPCLENLS